MPQGFSPETPSAETFKTEVTPAAHVEGKEPFAPKLEVTESAKESVRERAHQIPFALPLPPMSSGKSRLAHGPSQATLEADKRISQQATEPLRVPSLALSQSAKVTPRVPATVDVGSEPSSPKLEVKEPTKESVRERSFQIPLALPLRRVSSGQPRPAKGSSEVAQGEEKQPSQRATDPLRMPSLALSSSEETVSRGSAAVEPRSESKRDPVQFATLGRDPKAPMTVLMPSPPGPEPSGPMPGGAEKRAGVHIGSLEVRLVHPPAVVPSAVPFPRRPSASAPRTVLAQGFRSFGLTQG